jgi:hypothetical protein
MRGQAWGTVTDLRHPQFHYFQTIAVVESRMPKPRSGSPFRGNKATLPSKPCAVCGLAMTWRKRWAKNWTDVKYCSDACRRRKASRG